MRVFCYGSVRELGETMTTIAERQGLRQPAVCNAIDRGARMAKEREIKWVE